MLFLSLSESEHKFNTMHVLGSRSQILRMLSWKTITMKCSFQLWKLMHYIAAVQQIVLAANRNGGMLRLIASHHDDDDDEFN